VKNTALRGTVHLHGIPAGCATLGLTTSKSFPPL
jgi:hypothetical protein